LIRRSRPSDDGPGVPLWIITFSDMITLLLTFFVLLVSMGRMRDETLMDEGQGVFFSFLESVKAGFGIKSEPKFGNLKVKYSIENPELREGRTVDTQQERTVRLFKTLSRTMNARPSQIVGKRTNAAVTDIRFASGQASLDEAAKGYLKKLAFDLKGSTNPETSMVYVVGLAGDEATEQQKWTLSARRAQAAADYLEKALSSESGGQAAENDKSQRGVWQVFCWGAGEGAEWVSHDLSLAKRSHILIAVLSTKR